MSATYQWGGVARLDLVSAPPGTALVFYGPPALHVHAMPLLSQHDMVQSAAVLPAQHCTSQHDSAERDSAHLDAAQHDSAQAKATQPDESHSEQNGSSSHNSGRHEAAHSHSQKQKFSTHQDLSQASHAADSEPADGVMPAQHVSEKQSQRQAQQLLQEDAHATGGPRHAAAGKEGEGDNEGLFAEASVVARGGLKVTEKASHVAFRVPGLGVNPSLSHVAYVSLVSL